MRGATYDMMTQVSSFSLASSLFQFSSPLQFMRSLLFFLGGGTLSWNDCTSSICFCPALFGVVVLFFFSFSLSP